VEVEPKVVVIVHYMLEDKGAACTFYSDRSLVKDNGPRQLSAGLPDLNLRQCCERSSAATIITTMTKFELRSAAQFASKIACVVRKYNIVIRACKTIVIYVC